jgi:hypothetical protein
MRLLVTSAVKSSGPLGRATPVAAASDAMSDQQVFARRVAAPRHGAIK